MLSEICNDMDIHGFLRIGFHQYCGVLDIVLQVPAIKACCSTKKKRKEEQPCHWLHSAYQRTQVHTESCVPHWHTRYHRHKEPPLALGRSVFMETWKHAGQASGILKHASV